MICLCRALFPHRHASFTILIKFHADIAKRQGISFPVFLLARSANFWRKSTFSITPCRRAFLYSCTLSGMGPWRYGSVQRMRPGGDDRMRCTHSNGRGVEIGGVDGSIQRMRPGRGRPHASYALGREGRNTIWLNELFRGFAIHNVLAGKVTIG